jgi:hypothetical protein
MPTGLSLHIGIERVDPAFHGTWETPLPSAVNDAWAMRNIAHSNGFSTDILLTASATAEAILESIRRKANELKDGDIFFLSFSGHGANVPAESDIPAGNAWVTYQRLLGHAELNDSLSQFKTGVRVVLVSDSCFSGGLIEPETLANLKNAFKNQAFTTKTMPGSVTQDVLRSRPGLSLRAGTDAQLNASVIALFSSQENKASIALANHGLFTQKLLAAWDNGTVGPSYRKFFISIKAMLNKLQTPTYLTLGPHDDACKAFEENMPFTI